MGFLDLFKSKFTRWLETASYEDLLEGYEQRRQAWIRSGAGDRTPQMERIDDEIVRRMNERHRLEHPNAQPRSREHGWYLPNDD